MRNRWSALAVAVLTLILMPRVGQSQGSQPAGKKPVVSMGQNYPNPFNPTKTISFDLPQASLVTLKVYNMLGQEVATLVNNEELEDGSQEFTFDASMISTGVYFYRLTAQAVSDEDGVASGEIYTSVKKMVLVK